MKRHLWMVLLLVAVVLTACGSSSSKVTLDVPDDVAAQVDKAIYPKWQALHVMRDAIPKTTAELVGRRWTSCSSYAHANNNMMYLATKVKFLQITESKLIGGKDPKDWLPDCMEAVKADPETILVMDRDVEFELQSRMVELVLE